ncbi:unnamed protein product [Clonostachys rosea]|uniref:SMP-30/Gluconolactonase/LRE-like region domain-containing protein n=1 Tax=Bionectria ochroleuca TaxID=29856 RepID=A0ABY6TRV6_BIOOC|nr:unnamed protein product [Clonostachys rosea]
MHISTITVIIGLSCLATSKSVPKATLQILDPIQLPTSTIASLGYNNTFLENLAARQNGDLLVTMLEDNSTLYYVESPGSGHTALTPIHHFSAASGLLGITETSEDTFLIAMHDFEKLITPIPGTGAIWEVRFTRKNSKEIKVRKVTDLPNAGMMNGITSVPARGSSGSGEQEEVAILVADSYNGQLIRVDSVTGYSEVVLDVPELHARPNATFPIGVNGVKIYNGHVYWSNFERSTMNRIAIDRNGYPLGSGTVSTIATIPEIQGIDDFVFDQAGNIWGMGDLDNNAFILFRGTDPHNEYSIYQSIAGGIGSLLLPGCTASTWGRGKNDKHILYVTTNGGMVSPVNGTIVEPAKVAAIDTSQFANHGV